MARADRTIEVDVVPRLHELRIIRGEVRPYLAYCPCGGFVLETGFPNFISWSYRKHINGRSADLPTCSECAEVVHDADCPLVGDGRPVDGMTLQTIDLERFRALPNPEQERLLAEIKERFGLDPEDVTEAYLDDRGSVRGVARIVKDENGQIVVEYAAGDFVLDSLGETPSVPGR